MLSICIPNYTRVTALADLLKSLETQDLADVEICISDNASQDGARELVRQWKPRLGRVVYHEWSENVGFDRNVLKVVEIASGEYCWLMGNDDVVAHGAVARVKSYAHVQIPGVIVGYRPFSVDAPSGERARVATGIDNLIELSGDALLHAAPQFGFMSRQVFRRRLWQVALQNTNWKSHIGNNYIHLYMLLAMVLGQDQPHWYLDHAKLVFYRTLSFQDQITAYGTSHNRLVHEISEGSRILRDVCTAEQARLIATAGVRNDLYRNLSFWRQNLPTDAQKREMISVLRAGQQPKVLDQVLLQLLMRAPVSLVRLTHKAASIFGRYKRSPLENREPNLTPPIT